MIKDFKDCIEELSKGGDSGKETS